MTAVSILQFKLTSTVSKPAVDVIRELNDCTSLTTLHCFYDFYKNLVSEISQSNIFFHCETGCDKTKITIKSLNGTEFMYFLTDDLIELVPVDIQREILQSVLELCSEAMECIEKQIPAAEELDRKKRQEEIFQLMVYVIPGFFLTIVGFYLHNTDIAVHITGFLGITGSEIPELTFAFKFIGIVLMTMAFLTALKAFVRRNFSISINFR